MSNDVSKRIAAVVFAVAIILVLAITKLTLPFKTILWMSVAEFAVFVACYPWVWKRRNFTFRRLLLLALIVAGGTAVILGVSNLLARL